MSPDPLNVSHQQLNSFLVMLLTSKLIKIINRWPKSIPCWLWPSDIETTNSLHTQQALHSRSNSWHVLYRQSTWNASMCFTVNRLPSGLWTSWSVSLCRITSNGPCCSRGTSKLSYQHTSVRTTVSLTHYNTVRSMSVFIVNSHKFCFLLSATFHHHRDDARHSMQTTAINNGF